MTEPRGVSLQVGKGAVLSFNVRHIQVAPAQVHEGNPMGL
jgi:hypothetical protein